VLPPKGLTIIFAATRHHVEYLTTLIKCTGMSAVCIYGTMDVEARKSNLHVFRTGKVPVLVVTDVAARGLDVPMIDNVIHHSFPPSPKLFIHRSGRAARAGRVGYAFALVEPDETPFMVDLHLFLGRRVCNPMIEMRKKGDEKEEKEGGGLDAIEGIVEGEEEEEEEEEEAKAIDDEYKGNNSGEIGRGAKDGWSEGWSEAIASAISNGSSSHFACNPFARCRLGRRLF